MPPVTDSDVPLLQQDASRQKLLPVKWIGALTASLGFLAGAFSMIAITHIRASPALPTALVDDVLHLYYFGIEGRGEVARMALHAGGVSFTETFVGSFSDWSKLKTSGPPSEAFGVVPVITHGSFTLGESTAVAGYCAELGMNLYYVPSNEERYFDIMVLTAHEEIFGAVAPPVILHNDLVASRAAADKLSNTVVSLERFLGRNPGPFLYKPERSGPSVGDLAIYDLVTMKIGRVDANGKSYDDAVFGVIAWTKYPKIMELVAAVEGQTAFPGLTAYLKTRTFVATNPFTDGKSEVLDHVGIKPEQM